MKTHTESDEGAAEGPLESNMFDSRDPSSDRLMYQSEVYIHEPVVGPTGLTDDLTDDRIVYTYFRPF